MHLLHAYQKIAVSREVASMRARDPRFDDTSGSFEMDFRCLASEEWVYMAKHCRVMDAGEIRRFISAVLLAEIGLFPKKWMPHGFA